MPLINVVVGNPKPRSRTLNVATALAERLSTSSGLSRGTNIDLADHARSIFDWPSAELDRLNVEIRESEILIVATPTYKASYTGLLKAFLDRYPHNGLQGVTAIPVMTTSSPQHALAVEFTLRPLLVELGATVPTRGLTFFMPDMARLDAVLGSWLAENRTHLAPYLQLQTSVA